MPISRPAGRPAGRSTPQMHHGIYIMGCVWQPFWILLEKVGISFYFWIIRLVNSQLALYSHVRCNPPWCPNTPEAPPKHCHTTITNFNYEGSYLSGVICNIVVKADLGRWTPLGNREEMPGISVHQNWQMNLLWLMDPPSESSIDALNTTTPNLADESTLANGPILHCYWHLVVKNGNFTLLLTCSGQECQLADLLQDLLADLPPNASWDIYYGTCLAAILDSTRKGGNFLWFVNN